MQVFEVVLFVFKVKLAVRTPCQDLLVLVPLTSWMSTWCSCRAEGLHVRI